MLALVQAAMLTAMLGYTPTLQPLALLRPRAHTSPLVMQFDIGKAVGDMGKMGNKAMEAMGMSNPADTGLSDEESKAMEDRLKSGQMSFEDFLMQVKVMQKGASVQAMLGKMGGGQVSKEQLDEGQKKMTRYGKFVEAMDAEERVNAELIINELPDARSDKPAPRMERIAESSGATVEEVGRFVMEFNMMRGAAVRFANGESPESIRESMAAEQASGAAAPMNRKQRRLASKKKKKKPARTGGFGR